MPKPQHFTAFFLALCLTISQTSGHVFAGAASSGTPRVFPDETAIPEAYGSIDETHRGTNGKTVFYIQDAHDSLEAQENIAHIIKLLTVKHGVRRVFQEGYEGRVPKEKYFGSIQDAAVLEKVSYFLLDRLRLGGAEYAHVNSSRPFELIGADDLRLHFENIRAYEESAENREVIAAELEALSLGVRRLAEIHFPKEMKEWMKLKTRFDAGFLAFPDYLSRLLSLSPRLLENHGREFPNLRLFTELRLMEGPEAARAADQISPRGLFSEIKKAEELLARNFLEEENALRIFDYYRGVELLKRLNRIELTAEEFAVLEGLISELRTAGIARFIARESARPVVLSRRWESLIQSAVRFYEIAQKRDLAAGKALEANTEKITALVFGGFHKGALTEILKKQGYSYYVVSPKISGPSPEHEKLYKELMSGGSHSFEIPYLVSRAAAVLRAYELDYYPELIESLAGYAEAGASLEEAARAELRSPSERYLRAQPEIWGPNEFVLSSRNNDRNLPGGGRIEYVLNREGVVRLRYTGLNDEGRTITAEYDRIEGDAFPLPGGRELYVKKVRRHFAVLERRWQPEGGTPDLTRSRSLTLERYRRESENLGDTGLFITGETFFEVVSAAKPDEENFSMTPSAVMNPSEWDFTSGRQRDYALRLSKMSAARLDKEARRFQNWRNGIHSALERIAGGHYYAIGHLINDPFSVYFRAREIIAEKAELSAADMKKYGEMLLEGEQEIALMREIFYRWDRTPKPRAHMFWPHDAANGRAPSANGEARSELRLIEEDEFLRNGGEILRGGKSAIGSTPDERLSLVNEKGVLLPGGKSKTEVHRDGDWHETSHIYIFDKQGRLLLQKRSMSKKSSPGKFQVSVSGHVNEDETPQKAAQREGFEELGIRIDPVRLFYGGRIPRAYQTAEGYNREYTTIYGYVISDEEKAAVAENYNINESDEVWVWPVPQMLERIEKEPEYFSNSLRLIAGEERSILDKLLRSTSNFRSELRTSFKEPSGENPEPLIEYDAEGRLKTVKDDYGNVWESYEYKERDQEESSATPVYKVVLRNLKAPGEFFEILVVQLAPGDFSAMIHKDNLFRGTVDFQVTEKAYLITAVYPRLNAGRDGALGRGDALTLLNWLTHRAALENKMVVNSGTKTMRLIRLYRLLFAELIKTGASSFRSLETRAASYGFFGRELLGGVIYKPRESSEGRLINLKRTAGTDVYEFSDSFNAGSSKTVRVGPDGKVFTKQGDLLGSVQETGERMYLAGKPRWIFPRLLPDGSVSLIQNGKNITDEILENAPREEEMAEKRSELRIAANPSPKPDIRSLLKSTSDDPALILVPYDEIGSGGPHFYEYLFAAAYQTRTHSNTKIAVYGVPLDALGSEKMRTLRNEAGIETVSLDLETAHARFSGKVSPSHSENTDFRRTVLYAGNAERLKIPVPDGVLKFLGTEDSDIAAALLLARSGGTLPGVSENAGVYSVTSDVLRSQLLEYQASLIIEMAA